MLGAPRSSGGERCFVRTRRLTVPAAALLAAAVPAAPAPAAERARSVPARRRPHVARPRGGRRDRRRDRRGGPRDPCVVTATASRGPLAHHAAATARTPAAGAAAATERRRLAKALPGGRSAYHDYAEMVAEINRPSPTTRRSSRSSASARRTRAATSGPSRSPTTSAPTRTSPRCCSTHHQHAREHLTVEMALYLLNHAHRRATAPTPGSPTWSTAARSGSSRT